MSHNLKTKKSNHSCLTIIGIICIICLIFEYWLQVVIIAVIGGGIYYVASKNKRLQKAHTKQRLQNLKDAVESANHQTELLDNYLKENNETQYVIVAHDLLQKVRTIKKELIELKPHIDSSTYERVFKKSESVEEDILGQLKKLETKTTLQNSDEEKELLQYAPELTKLYQNIQKDHLTILKKIQDADNREELVALHEADMKRFQDVLDGYLKIKKSPKDYYNADNRLEKAKETLEKFDLALDETLRKLNESDLKDFDISLRMMADEEPHL